MSDFALLLVIFNSHHGSEGVKQFIGRDDSFEANSHLALLGGCRCCSPPLFAVADSSRAFVLCKLMKKVLLFCFY